MGIPKSIWSLIIKISNIIWHLRARSQAFLRVGACQHHVPHRRHGQFRSRLAISAPGRSYAGHHSGPYCDYSRKSGPKEQRHVFPGTSFSCSFSCVAFQVKQTVGLAELSIITSVEVDDDVLEVALCEIRSWPNQIWSIVNKSSITGWTYKTNYRNGMFPSTSTNSGISKLGTWLWMTRPATGAHAQTCSNPLFRALEIMGHLPWWTLTPMGEKSPHLTSHAHATLGFFVSNGYDVNMIWFGKVAFKEEPKLVWKHWKMYNLS